MSERRARRPGWTKEIPYDWSEDRGFHGFGRLNGVMAYSVRLSVNGKQHEIDQFKSQEDAARCYDAALWRLSAFAPLCAKPNFPEDFPAITLDEVERLCPFANTIYDEEVKKLEAAGVNVFEFLKAAAERRRIYVPKQTAEPGDVGPVADEFSAFEKRVESAMVEVTELEIKFSRTGAKLSLAKLPQLAESIAKQRDALRTCARGLTELREVLESNRDYYRKTKSGLNE